MESYVKEMTHLDISQNQFSVDHLLRFLNLMPKSKIRFLSLNSVSLKSDQPQSIRKILNKLVTKKGIQHIDLTNTKIDLFCVLELL